MSRSSYGGRLGPDSSKARCHSCGSTVMTTAVPVPGFLTWSLCIVLILLGCICGCCLIPFFVESCQDIEHRCPRCNHYIGKYPRCKM